MKLSRILFTVLVLAALAVPSALADDPVAAVLPGDGIVPVDGANDVSAWPTVAKIQVRARVKIAPNNYQGWVCNYEGYCWHDCDGYGTPCPEDGGGGNYVSCLANRACSVYYGTCEYSFYGRCTYPHTAAEPCASC